MTPLPLCSWRGERRNGRYPCSRPGIRTHPDGVRPETCAKCELFDKPPPAQKVLVRPKRTPLPCIYQGEDTGQTVKCLTCRGNVRVKVFGCEKYGRCVPGRAVASGIHLCDGCPDKATLPPSEKIVRNLLYHVYPVQGNGIWQWNLEQLKRRLHLFNGRKIIAIVHSDTVQPLWNCTGAPGIERRMPQVTDAPEAVVAALEGHGCEFLVMPNDPSKREMQTFLPMLEAVQTTDPAQVTLYAHAKGVTYLPDTWATQDWTAILYELYFDYWPVVESLLRKHPLTGAFKILGRGWHDYQSLADWYFSGSWFWFRNRDLFALPDWRRTDTFWSAVESYPALHYTPQEAGLIFFEGRAWETNLYRRDVFNSVVLPQWWQWRKKHAVLGS